MNVIAPLPIEVTFAREAVPHSVLLLIPTSWTQSVRTDGVIRLQERSWV
jgi:hypothetical protein